MPDIQLLFIAGSLAAASYLPPFRGAFADSLACRIVLLRPDSRGSVKHSLREIHDTWHTLGHKGHG